MALGFAMSAFEKQCKYCAFKLSEDQSTKAKAIFVEDKYRALHDIKNAPVKSRTVTVGDGNDRTETCFIDSPTWSKRKDDIYCKDKLDHSISLESALALREARISNRTALDAKTWAIIAAIIATIAAVIATT
ncbi:MAG: hypothetical protein ACYCZA_09610 [Thiobacillus sp.]